MYVNKIDKERDLHYILREKWIYHRGNGKEAVSQKLYYMSKKEVIKIVMKTKKFLTCITISQKCKLNKW